MKNAVSDGCRRKTSCYKLQPGKASKLLVFYLNVFCSRSRKLFKLWSGWTGVFMGETWKWLGLYLQHCCVFIVPNIAPLYWDFNMFIAKCASLNFCLDSVVVGAVICLNSSEIQSLRHFTQRNRHNSVMDKPLVNRRPAFLLHENANVNPAEEMFSFQLLHSAALI